MIFRAGLLNACEAVAQLGAPVRHALRKDRLLRLGCEDVPATAAIDPVGGCRSPYCLHLAADLALRLRRHNSSATWATPLARFRTTATFVDADDYPTHADYVRAYKKETDGNLNREIKKALRLGYEVRMLSPNGYRASARDILSSKRVRAGGLVMAVFVGRGDDDLSDAPAELVPPVCPHHWDIAFGTFLVREGEARMVAQAILRRVGNLIHTLRFMGHGDHLRQGVTKLLMDHVARWILERHDPLVTGARYLAYSYAEHGRGGLLEWKKDFKFKPYLIETDRSFPPALPRDFWASRYRRLHPDLAAFKDVGRHYRLLGQFENRRYR